VYGGYMRGDSRVLCPLHYAVFIDWRVVFGSPGSVVHVTGLNNCQGTNKMFFII